MIETDKFQKVEISSAEDLRAWLEKNHAQEESIWVVRYKKHVTSKYVSAKQLLDEILCYGWIDGLARKLDENRTMQLLSPRRAQHWALTYKVRAQKLIEAGRMHESGIKAIERSKELGLWDYMAEVDNLIVPEDLAKRLSESEGLLDYFGAYPPSYRRNVLRWLHLAKTPETRGKRISLITETTQKGLRIPQM